jgi:hypothetical protein
MMFSAEFKFMEVLNERLLLFVAAGGNLYDCHMPYKIGDNWKFTFSIIVQTNRGEYYVPKKYVRD